MTYKQNLITIGVIGFTFGGWFTFDTGGIYAKDMLLFCAGIIVSLVMFLVAASINTDEPHKRFKNCRKIEL